ncbi:hypothetical protein INR49_014616 [Caranx melampygus]|nr:hypothetical protein INR49_014616 [Caranx melampygus]
MEVEYAAGNTDLLMECDEEEQTIWPPTPETDEKEKDGGLETVLSPVEGETGPPPVRIIPLPVQPVNNCTPSTVTPTVKSPGHPLGFRVNGRLVPLVAGDGSIELKLHSHPKGSVSGFTTVQIPITVTVHSPAGSHQANTTTSPTTSITPQPAAATAAAPPETEPEPEPEPEPGPTPIITGVVSGEAAQRVLSNHTLNFKSSQPQMALKTPPAVPSRPTQPSSQLAPVAPPDCPVCLSQYKLIAGLRGFMCLCSPAIAESLKNLQKKKKKVRRKIRTPRSSSSKASKTKPGHPQKTHRLSDEFLTDPFTSPTPSYSNSSPKKEQTEPEPSPPQGKLVILVEDFYYGSDPRRTSKKTVHWMGGLLDRTAASTAPRCSATTSSEIHTDTQTYIVFTEYRLRTGVSLYLRLMSHMRQHLSTTSQEDTDSMSSSSVSSCPHCFRHFLTPFKLQCHVEAVHSQCESTVTCRICELEFGSEPAFLWHMKTTHKPGEMPTPVRSSFYSEVWTHFEQFHANTKHLLCQYCLRVLRSNTCYQQHFARHQKKHVFGCDKCRLHFLYLRERMEHKQLHHKTHIRPPQLTGLKPGTKVVDIDPPPPPPPPQEAQRRRVESLGTLLVDLSEEVGVSHSHPRCVECLSVIRDFRTHFPSRVHCSLCSFTTCCSTSYANHMINNHATCSRNPQYQSIFLSFPRLLQKLKCESCSLSTHRGDLMANHLTLSVKPLTSPSPLTSPPAMTIKILRSHTQPEQERRPPAPSPLTVSQLSTVLSSLCHGLSHATQLYKMSPLVIRSWTLQHERGLLGRKWSCEMEKMVEELLSQREQQLIMSEESLLQAAREALGEDSQLMDCYSWTVDLMLRHSLSLQTTSTTSSINRAPLPKNIRQNIITFIQSLSSQIQTKGLPPHCLGAMDEISIFIHPDKFNSQDSLAFQLSGSAEDTPVLDVVLSALSDGTLLSPLLFFRGTASLVPDGFPDNVLLEAQQKGFTNEERLQIWIDKVWRPRVAVSGTDRQSVLMVDVHQGHQTDHFRDALSSASTDLVLIPSGCSCRLQPLDVCVTPVLKDFLQARWTQLVSQGGLDGLGLDQLALTLACWLSEVSSTLNSETNILRRSFSSVCDPQQVEDRREAERMIATLTEALIQPLETPDPGPGLGPELELLLVMEEEKMESKEEMKWEVKEELMEIS